MNHQFLKKRISKKPLFVTKEGLDTIKRYLDEITFKRQKAIQKLCEMDVSDRRDANTAEELQALQQSDSEIDTITMILHTARPLIKPQHPTVIALGCTVTLQANGIDSTYTIVDSIETDPETRKISEDSPLGKALLAKKVGDFVALTTQSQKQRVYKVLAIE